MWYVYVLESITNKTRYVGLTGNLKRRLKEHGDPKFKGTYTNKNRPYKLIYYEVYLNKYDAIKAEKFFKTGYGREILTDKLSNYLKDHNIGV